MKKLIVLLMVISIGNGFAQELSLIPTPLECKVLDTDPIVLTAGSKIIVSDAMLNSDAEYLQLIISSSTGFEFSVFSNEKGSKGDIILQLEKGMDDEAYELKTTEGMVEIVSSTPAGVFYGIQTLLQLLPTQIYSTQVHKGIEWKVPAVQIKDKPVFEWRGMHMDVARHFRGVDFVKRFIDLMAHHKLNTFHWHLTEDQGWRIEIKKYPKLTEVGAWRDSTIIGHPRNTPHKYKVERYGGFYTQEQIREIVEYAKQRHITIVPEIEMPGHARAAVTAYPEFGCTGEAPGVWARWGVTPHIYSPEEKTIEFVTDILDEILELFPGEYIHIGGDEAPKKQWEESERIQQLREERGLKDMHEMQSWFIQQIDNYLTQKGRKLIGWDEILEGGLAEGAAVMSWRGEKGGIQAAKMHHKVVMASNNYTYFDHYQAKDRTNEPLAIGGFLPLEKVFMFNPIPPSLTEKEAGFVMGAQAQLWSEYIPTDSHMEYMAFPRLCALSDVVWSNRSDRNYDEFLKSLRVHLKRLDVLDVNYRMPDELKSP